MPAARTADFTARWTTSGSRWWRTHSPVYGFGRSPCRGIRTASPVGGRARVLAGERRRHRDAKTAGSTVGLENHSHPLELLAHRRLGERRQDGEAVLAALAVPHGDLPVLEVQVLDSKAQAFRYAQPAAVHVPFAVPGFGYSVLGSGTSNNWEQSTLVLDGLAWQLEITEILKPGTQGRRKAGVAIITAVVHVGCASLTGAPSGVYGPHEDVGRVSLGVNVPSTSLDMTDVASARGKAARGQAWNFFVNCQPRRSAGEVRLQSSRSQPAATSTSVWR